MKFTATRLAALIALLVLSLTAFSCEQLSPEDASAANLVGYWKSSWGDGFEIKHSDDQWLFIQYDNAEKAVSFAGIIANGPDFNGEEGYIHIQITDGGSWGKTENYFYTVYWANLSPAGVEAGAASSADYTDPINNGLPTLAQARDEYTVANGYFGYPGEYVKQ